MLDLRYSRLGAMLDKSCAIWGLCWTNVGSFGGLYGAPRTSLEEGKNLVHFGSPNAKKTSSAHASQLCQHCEIRCSVPQYLSTVPMGSPTLSALSMKPRCLSVVSVSEFDNVCQQSSTSSMSSTMVGCQLCQ